MERQPDPPFAPKDLPVGKKATPLIGYRAFQVGTVIRVECVPAGAFITLDFGMGAKVTLRQRFIAPVPRR